MKTRSKKNEDIRYRNIALSVRAAEGDKPSVIEASVSSEEACPAFCNFMGKELMAMEILDHGDGAIDMSRCKDGLTIRDGHFGDQCGIMDLPGIKEKKLSGSIRFGAGARSKEIESDAIAGIRKNMSVGYAVDPRSYKHEGERDGLPILRAMRWTPIHAAFVPDPADITVGAGREESEIVVRETGKTNEGNHTMTPEEIAAKAKKDSDEREAAIQAARAAAKADGANEYAQNRREADAIAEQFKLPAEKFKEFTLNGIDIPGFRAKVMDWIISKPASRQQSTLDVQACEKDAKKKFSLRRLIAYTAETMVGGRSATDAGFELEISAEVRRQAGSHADFKGVPIPMGMRDFTVVGTSAASVQTTVLAQDWIDALRAKLVLPKLGVRIMSGLVGDIAIPKLSAGTFYWVTTEGTAPTQSAQNIAQVGGTPHIGGTYNDISWKLLRQSTPDSEMLIRDDLMAITARGIEAAVFSGTGSNGQPSGMKLAANIANPSVTTPTWAEIRGFQGTIEGANANLSGSLQWVMHPLVASNLAHTVKTSSYPVFILEESDKGSYIGRCPAHETTGVGSATAWLGDWSQVILGVWDAADMLVDPYTRSSDGSVRVRILCGIDVLVRNGQSFAYNDAMPVT